MTINKQTVLIHPIIDEFWSSNPSHERNSSLAQKRGQTTVNNKKEVIGTGANGSKSTGPDAEELRMNAAALAAR